MKSATFLVSQRSVVKGNVHLVIIVRLLLSVLVEGSLRLLDGAATSEGRLEMLWEGAWQALCSEGWGLPEVGVACRQLGFHEAEGLEDYEEGKF